MENDKKTTRIGKSVYEKKDHYHKEAKLQGYRARSAYKLQQINNKFKIIKKGATVLDIGAAPGGWSQVASELVGPEGRVISVDIVEMKPLANKNITILQGDITDEKIVDLILSMAGSVGCVISDIAPKTTGIVDLDRSRSAILSMQSLEIARGTLKTGGNFLTKVFQSQESEELFMDIKNSFGYSKRFRPPSTRKRSAEIYFIGKGFHHETDETADESSPGS